jgi:hypothetical protein
MRELRWILISLFTVGCNDDVVVLSPPGPDVPPDEQQGATRASRGYVLHTRVSSLDFNQESNFLLTVPSIEAGATFNLDTAYELGSDIGLASVPGSPFVWAGSCTEPTLTRWEVKPDGSLEAGPRMSFANLGLTDACIQSGTLFSADKAYHLPFQSDTPEIIVWNPTTMEISSTIALPGVEPEGDLLPVITLATRRDRLFVTVFWEGSFDQDWTLFGDHVRVIEIDTTTDTIVGQSEDTRCNSLSWASGTSDGTLYFSPYSYNTPVRAILGDEHGAASCGLRIVPPASSFDQGYHVDLAALAGERPAGDLIVLNDEVAFIHVWHDELVTPLTPERSNWEDVLGENGFLWWRWPIGSDAAEPILEQSPSNFTITMEVDGRKFQSHFSDDFSSTVLEELDPSGLIRPALAGPGQVFEVVSIGAAER